MILLFKKLKNKMALENISTEWIQILKTPELDSILSSFVDFSVKITPPIEKIFEFARLTDLNNIKLIILGQDPYPKPGDAHGLAFSSKLGIPASLKNIFKCLIHSKLLSEMPLNGDLTYLTEQGVLLLNCSLTTLENTSKSHVSLWKSYTQTLVSKLSKLKTPAFFLWGNDAKSMKSFIDKKCKIFEWSHPSPLACTTKPFLDCSNFKDLNNWLEENKLDPIEWDPKKCVNDIDEKFGMNKRRIVIFTDGSSLPNKACPESVGGYAIHIALGSLKDTTICGNLDTSAHFATNQRAEGYAIYKALCYIDTRKSEWDECVFVTDSEFWINMITQYMPKWERFNTPFTLKMNSDITIPLWKLYSKLLIQKHIEFRHMFSHDKDNWSNLEDNTYEKFCHDQNKYVDELASYARKSLKKSEEKFI